MLNNHFNDTVKQTALAHCLQNGLSYAEMMADVLDAYMFQENRHITDFMREFDSISELLIEQLKLKFGEPNYALIATEINKVIFGKHETGIRQIASQKELGKLTDFEKMLAYALANDFISTESDLIKHIQKHQK